MDVKKIMEDLGGTSSAARFFEVNPSAISQWKKANHIPRARLKWLRVVRPDFFKDEARKAA